MVIFPVVANLPLVNASVPEKERLSELKFTTAFATKLLMVTFLKCAVEGRGLELIIFIEYSSFSPYAITSFGPLIRLVSLQTTRILAIPAVALEGTVKEPVSMCAPETIELAI